MLAARCRRIAQSSGAGSCLFRKSWSSPARSAPARYNARLAALATKELALAGADVTRISLDDYPLPIYDGDLEAQVRPAGQRASSSSS